MSVPMEELHKQMHYRVGSEREDNLFRIIAGIEMILKESFKYNKETGGGVLDINEECESIYGLALIAMQNYINMICVDCFIISGNTEKKQLNNYSRSICAEGDKILNSSYTKVELIYKLANAIKHRNELELQCDKILWSSDSENELFARNDSYDKYTLPVLNDFDLLTPLNTASCRWEIYPVVKGMSILDVNWDLKKITIELCQWGKAAKRRANDEFLKHNKV
jgi:hypothetical protein